MNENRIKIQRSFRMKKIYESWNNVSLVKRIIIGMLLGVVFALLAKNVAQMEFLSFVSIFGTIFVSSLKAVAPILVFFLVMSALANHQKDKKTNMSRVLSLYLIGTFLAALTAVIVSFISPVTLTLTDIPAETMTSPQSVTEVLSNLIASIFVNPVDALMNANYLGILAWGVVLGLALQKAADSTKVAITNISDALTQIVRWVISLAPIGIMGLVFTAVYENGLDIFIEYGQLLAVLVATMLFVALVMNPIIVYINTRKNPYPLVFRCLKESGITAFFTRSSAANIPVNMELCEKLDLDKDTYSISIPLGATINMEGAAITITILTLAAAHTLGIPVSFFQALLLSVVAALCACGASGVAGGSLLLIPLACSLFGIPEDIAMQVVAIGFIIGVVQDSCETALNSSTDVVFTAAADHANKRKNESLETV